MTSPSNKDPNQRQSGDLGYKRVQGEVGRGRAFAWWWIVVLVAIALIVWWGGWGRHTGPTSTQSSGTAPVARRGIGSQPGASAGQPASKSGVTDQSANTPHNPR